MTEHSALRTDAQLKWAAQGRRNANVYSKALRTLRDRHPREFEEIWIGIKGEPRQFKNARRNKTRDTSECQ